MSYEAPPVVLPSTRRLTKRVAVVLALVGLILFGAIVEFRSAFLRYRKGDLNVFLRAAWAVRSGADLYDVTDDNGFHYLYPPLFAILLTPLADAPAGVARAGMLPYAVSVGICYIANLFCLALAVHWLALAVARDRGQGPEAAMTWQDLRLLPVAACLPAIGHTLMRGQVGLLLLLLLCAMAADYLRGRDFRAGLWLAGAICLKVIPAFLLLYPLWRRSVRALAGCGLGLLLGLIVIPTAVMGPVRTRECYERWADVMLWPALGRGEDRSRARELHNMTATDSQSFLVVMHNALHFDRSTRPTEADPLTRLTAIGLGGLLTVATLAAAGRRTTPRRELLLLGMLVLLMLFLSPVSHLHYFCLSVIPFMAITAQAAPARWLWALAGFNLLANALPHLPGLEAVRDLGLALFAALTLWGISLVLLLRRDDAPACAVMVPPAGAAA